MPSSDLHKTFSDCVTVINWHFILQHTNTKHFCGDNANIFKNQQISHGQQSKPSDTVSSPNTARTTLISIYMGIHHNLWCHLWILMKSLQQLTWKVTSCSPNLWCRSKVNNEEISEIVHLHLCFLHVTVWSKKCIGHRRTALCHWLLTLITQWLQAPSDKQYHNIPQWSLTDIRTALATFHDLASILDPDT